MPEDNKKNQQKIKNDPKEQRRKRNNKQPVSCSNKKTEKELETPKVAENPPPTVSEPPPEFYQNLKRETDDILKISEEANSKYKKKEIQSNWAKYEMPIESYDDIEEQENLGADYQALIDASLSVGGHFQFKHEKSWDVNTGPSPYDKYFEINMDNLNLALSSIPFYERNGLDLALFTESDIKNMDNRATKYKQKYYNDKKYNSPELQAQDKILSSLMQAEEKDAPDSENKTETTENYNESIEEDINLMQSEDTAENKELMCDKNVEAETGIDTQSINNTDYAIDEFNTSDLFENNIIRSKKSDDKKHLVDIPQTNNIDLFNEKEIKNTTKNDDNKEGKEELQLPKDEPKNPIIESPEDLEKWLDDFLDD